MLLITSILLKSRKAGMFVYDTAIVHFLYKKCIFKIDGTGTISKNVLIQAPRTG